MKITIVTGNENKAREIAAITGQDVENVVIDIPEIQSLDVAEVALDKARRAFEILGEPVIVDDTGLSINSLGGMPGALVVWFLDSIGSKGILKLMEGVDARGASVSTAVGYADSLGAYVFVGTVDGVIATTERGENGFGYDPIFVPDGGSLTYAEMSSEQKNSRSMRAIALEKLAAFLRSRQLS